MNNDFKKNTWLSIITYGFVLTIGSICISPGVLFAIFFVLDDMETLYSFTSFYTVKDSAVGIYVFLSFTTLTGGILLSRIIEYVKKI